MHVWQIGIQEAIVDSICIDCTECFPKDEEGLLNKPWYNGFPSLPSPFVRGSLPLKNGRQGKSSDHLSVNRRQWEKYDRDTFRQAWKCASKKKPINKFIYLKFTFKITYQVIYHFYIQISFFRYRWFIERDPVVLDITCYIAWKLNKLSDSFTCGEINAWEKHKRLQIRVILFCICMELSSRSLPRAHLMVLYGLLLIAFSFLVQKAYSYVVINDRKAVG